MQTINRLCLILITAIITCFTIIPSYGDNVAQQSKYIIIINSNTETVSWSDGIINVIMGNMPIDAPDMPVYTENLADMMNSGPDLLAAFKSRIDREYTTTPHVIIYIGNTSWRLLHEYLEQKWGAVTSLLCADKDYLLDADIVSGSHAMPAERITMKELAATHHNLTVVSFKTYIKETIDLMKRLLPEMNELLFISDQRIVSFLHRMEMARICKEYFPGLKLNMLTEGEIPTDELLGRIQDTDKEKVGILLFSWIQSERQRGDRAMSSKTYKILSMYGKRALFVLNDLEVSQTGNIIGGYFTTAADNDKILADVLKNVLSHNDGNGQYYFPPDPMPVFNYESLTDLGLDPSRLPSDTFFYNKPHNILSQYKYHIAGILSCFVILLLIIQLLLNERKIQRKESELTKNYKNLFNNMPLVYMDEIIVRDNKGEIVDFVIKDVNPYMEKEFGDKSNFIDKKGSDLHMAKMDDILQEYKKIIKDGLGSFQYYNTDTNKYYTIIISPSQKANHIDTFMLDTTGLVTAQQKLDTTNHKLAMALDATNLTSWKMDIRQGIIIYDKKSSDTGISEQHSILLSDYVSRIHRDDIEYVDNKYKLLISGASFKFREEYRLFPDSTHNGKFMWVLVHAIIDEWDEKGMPASIIGSLLITTERKNIELELIEAKEKAEESNKLKTAFLANMSHEIRTPLNAIVGFSDLLATTDNEQEKREYCNIIADNNKLLLQLISDILDLAKIEAGTLEFVYSDVDINALLGDIVQSAQLRVDADAIKVELMEITPECFAHVDKNRLTQVMSNFVTNAIKFTPHGRIEIGCRHTDDDMLYFYVRDTGCGIPKEKQNDVFARFVKLSQFAQGTGLGLSICQTIIKHMNGRIGVESDGEDKGATFWCTIPYRPALGRTSPKYDEPSYEEAISLECKPTVLVAEDNPDNFTLFEAILYSKYNVVHAWNGREAVELFGLHKPNIILMDINMPEMDGYEAAATIREQSKRIPIIAVTAYAYASDEERIMRSGFNAYVPKPINAGQLLKTIASFLGR